jgi:hypothetical protein
MDEVGVDEEGEFVLLYMVAQRVHENFRRPSKDDMLFYLTILCIDTTAAPGEWQNMCIFVGETVWSSVSGRKLGSVDLLSSRPGQVSFHGCDFSGVCMMIKAFAACGRDGYVMRVSFQS